MTLFTNLFRSASANTTPAVGVGLGGGRGGVAAKAGCTLGAEGYGLMLACGWCFSAALRVLRGLARPFASFEPAWKEGAARPDEEKEGGGGNALVWFAAEGAVT